MNGKIMQADALDEIAFRLECGTAIINAIHTACTEGDFCGKQLDLALFGAYDFLRGIHADFQAAIDAAERAAG